MSPFEAGHPRSSSCSPGSPRTRLTGLHLRRWPRLPSRSPLHGAPSFREQQLTDCNLPPQVQFSLWNYFKASFYFSSKSLSTQKASRNSLLELIFWRKLLLVTRTAQTRIWGFICDGQGPRLSDRGGPPRFLPGWRNQTSACFHFPCIFVSSWFSVYILFLVAFKKPHFRIWASFVKVIIISNIKQQLLKHLSSVQTKANIRALSY